jgi:hypothetical protein
MTHRLAGLSAIAALLILTTGTASAATFGGSLSPATLVVETNPARTVTVKDRGEVPVSVALAIGTGWAVAPDAFELTAGQAATATIVKIGREDTHLVATFRNSAPGQDRASIVLSAVMRHWNLLEQAESSGILPAILLGIVLVLLLAAGTVLFRRRRTVAGGET